MCLDVYCTELHWPWHIAAWVKDYVNKPTCFLQANKKLLKGIQQMLQGVQIQVLFMSRKKCNTVSITFLYTTYMELQIVYAVCRYTHISRRKDWKRRGVGKTSLFQDQLTWVLSQPASHSEQWSPTWTPHFSFFFFFFFAWATIRVCLFRMTDLCISSFPPCPSLCSEVSRAVFEISWTCTNESFDWKTEHFIWGLPSHFHHWFVAV